MLPISDIERLTKERTKNVAAATHNFSHLKRTAEGARWFCKVLDGTKEEQEISYVAGLVHDFERPLSEVEHKDISFTEAKRFLEDFQINKDQKKKILSMVKEHRYVSDMPILQQCLFLSDKLLEQSGAYIIFRRCVYVGECLDFMKTDFSKATVFHWKERMGRFKPAVFDKRFRALAEYQYAWQKTFLTAFNNNENWAVDMARVCYEVGRKHNKTLEGTIRTINTTKEGKRFKDEALSYISGRKFTEFRKMIA